MNEVSKTLPSDDVWSRQTLVVVNAPDVTMSFYVIARKASRLETLPAYVRFLSMTDGELEIERENERTLTIRWPDGLHTRPIDRFFRGKRFPYALGDSFRLTGFVARVTALTEDGRPAEARFEFDVPLEDPSLRWFSWKGKGYTPFVPPSVGEQITFPRVKVLF
jgi:hypothetical protein